MSSRGLAECPAVAGRVADSGNSTGDGREGGRGGDVGVGGKAGPGRASESGGGGVNGEAADGSGSKAGIELCGEIGSRRMGETGVCGSHSKPDSLLLPTTGVAS